MNAWNPPMNIRSWSVVLTVALAAAAGACEDEGDVFSLEVGTCFNDTESALAGGETSNVPVVECDEPHDNEVFALVELEGDEFPGNDTVRQVGNEKCLAEFEDYVGLDYPSSRYAAGPYLTPTEESWERANDREVICALWDANLEKLEGSARGSAE